MNIYTLHGHDPRHVVVVRWNHALGSYTLTVYYRHAGEERTICQYGHDGNLRSLNDLYQAASHYAELSHDIMQKLILDRVQSA